ncbi:glycosyltransferase 25 family member 1 [Agrobacterium tumefaciens str. Cherry 2E-2-2]|uniref:glycosyltransferase family 25 protein n=1 Tax=Agrobacterium TaxID=357 RepID=UPI0002CA7334|nr:MULTISPECIES: glycosyltransferase family 25 protein [Agrobacterium]EMS96920.1 glycosyltransferase 25 family member 1 [Agrobacterium tumefaciens str. Cherry 2E-2-2]KVK50747.1 glycosyltransferase 25 family member 1 [Agrobacterium sp. D14]MCZ7933643.1 glycosyltransferase family 25 protein [Agrobacterium leguminum]NTB98378.1 glycosyltransferase family 25 protein [Agrobacterium tumefaciens]NTC45747.1 glycosyltransferase family 25 protein [Agrobacterium tumefaciens]
MHILPKSQRRLAVFLINMDSATKRLADMTARLDAMGLKAERVPGVNGRELNYPIPEFSEISYMLMHGRRTSPPEIGCYLSHVACANKFMAGDADIALILEDDVVFDDDFLNAIDEAVLNGGDWDLLRLTTVSNGRKFPFRPLSNGRSLAIAITREKGSGAYLVNRRAGKWISKLIPMRLAYDIAFDLEYLAGLKAAFLYPLCATQDADGESQIQNNLRIYRLPRWRYFTVLPYRAYLETSRFLLRGIRFAVAKVCVAMERGKGKTAQAGH